VPDNRCDTIEQVVAAMTERWQALNQFGDWRAVFAKTYLRTTEAILEVMHRPGVFESPAWIVELDCEFARRYFDAFDQFESTGECPWPWRLAFRSAVTKRTLAIQDVLLGMNAHINYDLPYSLHATIPHGLGTDDLEAYRRDNLAMNRVLGSAIDKVQREVTHQYDLVLSAADAALRDRGEVFAGEMIRAWRARSWSSFVVLRSGGDTVAVEHLIEESAIDNAVLLLQVQRAFPAIYWPNRLYRDSLNSLSRRRRSR